MVRCKTKSKTNTLSVIRGTTFSFLVKLYDTDGKKFVLEDGDILTFGVKEYLEHRNCIISKSLGASDYNADIGGFIFDINPEDTIDLSFGDYFYDVIVTLNTGEIYSVIDCSKLVIKRAINGVV